jgi:uncharacterized phage protein (TIGR02218 family)
MRSATNIFSAAVHATEQQIVELYQVTLVTSDRYYFANLDTDVPSHASLGGVTWQALPVQRAAARFGADLSVDDMTVQIANAPLTFAGQDTTLAALAMRGLLDGAEVVVYQTDWTNPASAQRFVHSRWHVQGAEADRATVRLQLEAPTARLLSLAPKRTFQEQCTWPLFSTWCTLIASEWTVYAHVVGSGTTTAHLQFAINSAGPNVAWPDISTGWLALGRVVFTSGALSGLRRSIGAQPQSVVNSAGQVGGVDLVLALPVVPASGDTCELIPGCNKTTDHCEWKFLNLPNFGGFPYIPKPETVFFG